MEVLQLKVQGAFVRGLQQHEDSRGWFMEVLRSNSLPSPMQQVNVSHSSENVLRGIHVTPFDKYVTAVHGSFFDVVVDFRPQSSTFLKWDMVRLASDRMIHIPANCGHAVLAMEDNSVLLYVQMGMYDPQDKRLFSVRWNDPQLGIDWPLAGSPILSDQDANAKIWSELKGS